MRRVVILGAGFGGLELAARLSETLTPDEASVVLIDKNDSFVFGFSKLDVMYGRRTPEAVRLRYRDIAKKGVEFRQELITSIDPVARRVVTDHGAYEADFLVVALGADMDTSATPGLVEGGFDFYSVAGAEHLRTVLPSFRSGIAIVGVLGPTYKCPPAPLEAAILLHDYLSTRGVRQAVRIQLFSPWSAPIPVTAELSEVSMAALAERDIEFWPRATVRSLDPTRRVAALQDGRLAPYDLFLGVPVHRAPAVVEESGLTVDGWIPVDHQTFSTRFPGVYAVGDVTSAPVPKAGLFAEGEARTVADVIISQLRGTSSPAPYSGTASCYAEFGDDKVARIDVDFLSGPEPSARYHPPSLEMVSEKKRFASSRRERWFGR